MIAQEALKKAMDVINKMKETRYSENAKKNIRITSSLVLEINGIIDDFEDSVDCGKPLYFEVYAIKNGIAADCMTLDMYRDFEADITYLLNCYM